MSITVHIPSPPLDTYINCLWYCDKPMLFPCLKILPLPSLHLMINFGSNFHISQEGQQEPLALCTESWSVGLWSTYHFMHSPPDMQILNVSFKPGGAYPFLQLPLVELHNQFVSLDAIWGYHAAEIRERLHAVSTTAARFTLLETLLLKRLRESSCDELQLVLHAVREISRQHGMLSIRALSDQIGISQKHLIAHFKRSVGGTPKALARLYRFKYVLDRINPFDVIDWTAVAHQACYYDQSHFNREFEAFTGHKPSDFLRLWRDYCIRYPDRAHYPFHLPTG